MASFFSIPTFRNSVETLCSKRKEGYMSVMDDIKSTLSEIPMEEIRINRDMVYQNESFTIVKLRVRNSGLNISKKDGFRLIYLAFSNKEEVILLNVYPKRGAKGLITVSQQDILSYLNEYLNVINGEGLEEVIF